MWGEKPLGEFGEGEEGGGDVAGEAWKSELVAWRRSCGTELGLNLRDASLSLLRKELLLQDRVDWSPRELQIGNVDSLLRLQETHRHVR